MGRPHGAEIVGDIKNFTNVQPLVQINDELGRSRALRRSRAG